MDQKNIKALTSLIIISLFIPIFVYGDGGGGDGGGGDGNSSGIDSGTGRAGGVGTPGVGGGFGGGSEGTGNAGSDSGTGRAGGVGTPGVGGGFNGSAGTGRAGGVGTPGVGGGFTNNSTSAVDRGYAQAQKEKEDWDNSVLGKISSLFGVEKSISVNSKTGKIGLETTASISIAGVITGIALGPLGFLAGPAVGALDRSLGVSVVDVSLGNSANSDNGGVGGNPFGSSSAENSGGENSNELRKGFLKNRNSTPQIVFTVDKKAVSPGDTVSLSWEVKNADRCKAEGGTSKWSGNLKISGKFIVDDLKISKIFSIRCFGPGGERSKSLIVSTFNSGNSTSSVDQLLNKKKIDNKRSGDQSTPPKLTLAAYPMVVEYGGRSKVVWSSKGATICTAHDDWPLPQIPLKDGKYYKSTSGEQMIYPVVSDMSITLICFNERNLFTKKTVNITVITP